MVDHPDAARVETIAGEQETCLVVSTHPSDVGIVIGAGGRTARSLRSLLTVIGGKHKRRFSLELPEGERSQAPEPG